MWISAEPVYSNQQGLIQVLQFDLPFRAHYSRQRHVLFLVVIDETKNETSYL